MLFGGRKDSKETKDNQNKESRSGRPTIGHMMQKRRLKRKTSAKVTNEMEFFESVCQDLPINFYVFYIIFYVVYRPKILVILLLSCSWVGILLYFVIYLDPVFANGLYELYSRARVLVCIVVYTYDHQSINSFFAFM